MANFKGKVERVRNNAVEGWAWQAGHDSPEVTLYIDGEEIAQGVADRMRGDLRDAGIGDGRGGFVIAIPPEFLDGNLHGVSVRITGAAGFINAYPMMAVLRDEAAVTRIAPAGPAAPGAAPVFTPQAVIVSAAVAQRVAVASEGLRLVRGLTRLIVAGKLADSDLPARLVVDEQSITVTRLDDDHGFVAVFDLAHHVPVDEVSINGVPRPIPTTTATLFTVIDGRDLVRAIFIPLDGADLPSTLRLRVADRAILHLAVDGRAAVFGTAGIVAAGVTVPLGDLVRAAQAEDVGFVLGQGALLDLDLIDGDGGILAKGAIDVSAPVRFHLEQAGPDRVVGWMVRDDDKTRYAQMDMFLGGVRYTTLTGDRHRQDVIRAGHAIKGGGFQVAPLYAADGEARLQFAPRFSRDFLPLKATTQAAPAPVSRLDQVYGLLRDAPAVTVLLPVRNDAKDVRRRLEGVLKYTPDCRILIVDDASHDLDTAALVRDMGSPDRVILHREPRSLGVPAALNRGLELAGRDDVAIVGPGVSVGPGWLDGLRAAAWSDPRVATATPCSNHAGGFSVPEVDADNALPGGLRSADAARLVRQLGAGIYPRVPTGSGFCLYIRRDCLDAIGGFDAATFPKGGEDIDLCLRAGRAGFIHVVDDRTFVYNRRWAPATPNQQAQVQANARLLEARYPEYAVVTDVFTTSEPMLAMRWRMRKAWQDRSGQQERDLARDKSPSPPKPRILYVISTRSGGTPQTNRDLMQAISDRYEPWVMVCDSQRVELSRLVDGREDSIATIRLDTAVRPANHTSSDYADAVSRLLLTHGFELVHIRHLAWHGIDLPGICRTLGLPVVLSLHDFYTLCPNIKLLDQDQVYCGGKCTATAGECSVDLWPQSNFPPLKHHFIHRWQAMFGQVFPDCDALVTTSNSARDIVRNVYPALATADFRVIPHGRSFPAVSQVAVKPGAEERLRVLVPGNISPAKGADLINAMVALDTDQRIEFHLLGDPGRVVEAATVIRHGLYEREDFAGRVAAIRPHIGAVLSIWPETYCHTLTEMWACGLPVAGIDIGAVGERLHEHGGGWLLPVGGDARAIHAHLLSCVADWDARVAQVVAWQAGYGASYGTVEMADAYDNLYRDLWRRRLAAAG